MHQDWDNDEYEQAMPEGSGVLLLLLEAAFFFLSILFLPYRLYRRLNRHRG